MRIFLFCILASVYATENINAFFDKMRSNDVVVYKIFGITWGWKGDKKLAKHEVQQYIQKRTQPTSHAYAHTSAMPFPSSDITKVNNVYRYLIENPKEVQYCQESHYLWGLITFKNKWSYPVAWIDDPPSEKTISIINETGETIFIDASEQTKRAKKVKKLRGIHDGKERTLQLPTHHTLIFWRQQHAYESLDSLITAYKINPTTRIIRLRKEKNIILAEAAVSHAFS